MQMKSYAQIASLGIALVLAIGVRAADEPAAAANDSPFAPLPGAAGSAAAPEELFELAGASATGQGTEVCIYNSQTKRSTWIAVGSSRDGVEVVSFDPDRDQAVVSLHGQRKTLSLRKAVVTAAPVPVFTPPVYAPAPPGENLAAAAPQPVGPQPVGTSSREQKIQEREARMLISDLMQIGMEQRKAYAEAKRQAALKAAAGGQ